MPFKKKRDGTLKIPHGSIVMTCFTSVFLLKDADEWRDECWEMIKRRDDCMFYSSRSALNAFRNVYRLTGETALIMLS